MVHFTINNIFDSRNYYRVKRIFSEQVHFGQSWPSLVKLAEVASVFTSSVHHPGLGPLGPGATLDLHS